MARSGSAGRVSQAGQRTTAGVHRSGVISPPHSGNAIGASVGRSCAQILLNPAEFESDLIRLRTREGMKVANAKGRLRGKQPKLNRRQEAHLVSLVHSGEYSTAEVADLFGVGRSTVYRAIERQRIAARAGLAEATSRR